MTRKDAFRAGCIRVIHSRVERATRRDRVRTTVTSIVVVVNARAGEKDARFGDERGRRRRLRRRARVARGRVVAPHRATRATFHRRPSRLRYHPRRHHRARGRRPRARAVTARPRRRPPPDPAAPPNPPITSPASRSRTHPSLSYTPTRVYCPNPRSCSPKFNPPCEPTFLMLARYALTSPLHRSR